MATGLAPFSNSQFFTDSGAVAAGYYLYSYLAGTTTPQNTKTDQGGSTNNANPIILDAAGRCNLWLTDTAEYAFELWTPPGSPTGALVKRWDDVGAIPLAATSSYVPLAGGVTMTGRFNLSATAVSSLEPVPLTQLTSAIATAVAPLATTASVTAASPPIGTIAMWAQGTPSASWLFLEGANVSRTTYATLFALWGTAYGVGDGSTTFGLPDLRAYFPRGWDNGRGIDSGRALGSFQADAYIAHTHGIRSDDGDGANPSTPTGQVRGTDRGLDVTVLSDSSGDTETRPKNFALRFIVRAL